MNKFFWGICIGIVIGGIICTAIVVHGGTPVKNQLDTFGEKITVDGKIVLLVADTPLGHKFHVMDFDTAWIKQAKTWGVNHVWVLMSDLYQECKFSYTQYPGQAYWDKLHLIAKTCYENDMILGICYMSFSVYSKPGTNAFNRECGGLFAPLSKGVGFFTYNSKKNFSYKTSAKIQKYHFQKIAETTWMYPNVYYTPMWEIGTSKVPKGYYMEDWVRWFRRQLESYGNAIIPMNHLFAIEKTCTVDELARMNMDFVWDEDGNTQPTNDVPFVYWSMDGVFRYDEKGKINPYWNNEIQPNGKPKYPNKPPEPQVALDAMRVAAEQVAGISSVWESQTAEKLLLEWLSYKYNKPISIPRKGWPAYLDKDQLKK